MSPESKKIPVLDIDVVKGEIRYSFKGRPGRRITLHPADRIEMCSKYPFTIQFAGLSPFTTLAGPQRDERYILSVASNASAGTYKYSVALWADPTVLIDDPEVVIESTEGCN